MTNSENGEKEAKGYEVLPAVKHLTLPLGIRCMEVNVQEVDEAVRQFNKKAGEITSPSWKFPHITLEKLDVNNVMNALRTHGAISDDQLYMELMELLIDRLYYAIMTSFEFVNGLEALFVNAGVKLESTKFGVKSRPCTENKADWDPLEIANRSSEDNTPKPFHTANIGMLVRQFSIKMVGLENILLNNLHYMKKSARNEDSPKNRKDYFSRRHCEVQTDETMQDGCDSCFIAQNILKFVAEKIDTALRAFKIGLDSKIVKTRVELRKDALSITQRGTLLRWSKALKEDCDSITNCANLLLDINVKNQDDVRALKESLELKVDEHEHKMRECQACLEKLTAELQTEQESRGKLSKQKDVAIIKTVELEKMLQIKLKECDKLLQEREALQRSFNIAEELNLQIKSNMARTSAELVGCKKDLVAAVGGKEESTKLVRNLSMELAKAGQEIMRMQESTDKARYLESENGELKHEVRRLKSIVEKFETRGDDIEKALHERDTKIKKLETELYDTQTKIEVLTVYPDLNGPVNTPTKSSGSSCIETMEMQVKSNNIRMEILKAQSDRLSTTVSKLRAHMISKSKTDIRK